MKNLKQFKANDGDCARLKQKIGFGENKNSKKPIFKMLEVQTLLNFFLPFSIRKGFLKISFFLLFFTFREFFSFVSFEMN